MSDRRDIHERVLQAKNPAELADAYADWAEKYDADLVGEMGYEAPRATAEILHAALTSSDVRILDAGCGTGLVGEELHRLGYKRLVGLDYSNDMLEHARRKNVYVELLQGDLTKPLELEAHPFDATICVGTFTLGHVGPEAIAHLISVTKAGGLVCITVRDEAWEQDDYAATIRALQDEQLMEVIEERHLTYIVEEASSCRVFLMKVN
ncbi:MAG: class I SAM-dependent methyltransferase [Pseudomonadaceae bacterium]|nr:class I SAM-dependent methyltransferase [Pseudomonadaceae bacterium]